MNRPQVVLFDWDNTLVDSWGTIHDALSHTFLSMGQEPWTLAEVKERTRHSLSNSFPALFGARWQEARQHYLDRFTAIHLERVAPISGVPELLNDLAAEGIRLGVVSNKTGAILRREAAHLGWTDRFVRLVGAGDAAADKPDAAPVRLALEGLALLSDKNVWYVGDTALDMECAANAGCVGVLLHVDLANEPGLVQFPPALNFLNSQGLASHIKGL